MSGPTFNNRGLRSFNGTRTFSKKLDHQKRAAARRAAMDGYPIESSFENPEEVHEYLNADRITCLRCGKSYKALAKHLKIHGWTEAQYKEFYGLPWKTGLTSRETKKRNKDAGTRLYQSGRGFAKMTADERESARQKAVVTKKRKRAKYRNVMLVQIAHKDRADRLAKNKDALKVWVHEDYERVIARMRSTQRFWTAICDDDDDVPSRTVFFSYIKQDQALGELAAKAINDLPFNVQAKHRVLGKRFRDEAKRLRMSGLTSKQIGEHLCVHWVTVEKHISGAPFPPKTHCVNGHPYPPGKRKCKICNTENKRKRNGHMPRHVAAKTIVDGNCSKCSAPIKKTRLSQNRDKLCSVCRYDNHRATQNEWSERQGGRMKEYQKAYRMAKKGDESLLVAYAEKYPSSTIAKNIAAPINK